MDAEDYAFWQRACLVEFPLSFVDREPKEEFERRADKELYKKLKEETPGILAWLLRGCLEWQTEGLNPPDAVVRKTDEYRASMDVLGDFLSACCRLGPGLETKAAELYDRFSKWFESNVSTNVMNRTRFGRLMTKRGFQKIKRKYYFYQGIEIIYENDI